MTSCGDGAGVGRGWNRVIMGPDEYVTVENDDFVVREVFVTAARFVTVTRGAVR